MTNIDDAAVARNRLARNKALEAMAAIEVSPASVVRYNSRGRVIIIGGMEALEFAPRLQSPLRPEVLLTEGIEEPGVPVTPLGGRVLTIEGHLGAFTLKLGAAGKPNYQQLQGDLVLDLTRKPRLKMPLPPPGYITAGLDDASLTEAAHQLQNLVGSFEKPRYFQYDPILCAHQRAGHTACTRCIDACPAEAIHSIVEAVEVDADRCQGGGICATVCPAGAIRYAWPGVEESLTQVKTLLDTYRKAGGRHPVLVICPEEHLMAASELPGNHLIFQVEELASLGLEFWMGALSYGASQVLLFKADELPQTVESALAQQLLTGRQILEALGYPADALLLQTAEAHRQEQAAMPDLVPATFAPAGDKRQLFFTALDHLHAQAEKPRPLAVLEAGAPFGTAQVDAQRCTLCNACVGACPGKALQTSVETPGIRFVEANCLQCGMCTRTCPEDAIAITPRLVFDRDKRNRMRLLHQEEPFHCVSCGTPFATRTIVNRMHQALQGHWMFQDERARQRLNMCEQCRVVDIAQDPAAMEAGGRARMDHY